jgi:RNA polymerase sigma factor (sigma-70 family)
MMVGVDVIKKRKDIERLLYKACGGAIKKYGYEFDDLLQEVFIGILKRNKGQGAYDPSRSAFSHYIILVCNSIFRNYHAKEMKRRGREILGARNKNGDIVDVKEIAVDITVNENDFTPEKYLEFLSEKIDDPRTRWEIRTNKKEYKTILSGIVAGFSKDEISKSLQISKPKMHKIMEKCCKKQQNKEIVENNILDLLNAI